MKKETLTPATATEYIRDSILTHLPGVKLTDATACARNLVTWLQDVSIRRIEDEEGSQP